MTDQSKSLDILGIKPIAESINTVTSATVNGAASFLGRICLPAAEEFGLLLRDRVRGWRAANIAAITARAEERLKEADAPSNVHAHPRLVSGILEEGSWIEDPIVQDLWGGLLSSSCTEDGNDDSNLVFVNLLSELTKLQARLLKYVCENSQKWVLSNGLIQSREMTVAIDTLTEITGETDIHRLDREMDHLREVGLIHGGFDSHTTNAQLAPSPIALYMYVRCHGSRTSPIEFFGIDLPKPRSAEVEPTDDAEGAMQLPSVIQSQLGVKPGDDVVMETRDGQCVIRPVRAAAGLCQEGNVLVHRGTSNVSAEAILAESRQERLNQLGEGLSG